MQNLIRTILIQAARRLDPLPPRFSAAGDDDGAGPAGGTGAGEGPVMRSPPVQDRGSKRAFQDLDPSPGLPAFRIADEWSNDVRVFYPTLGHAHATTIAARNTLDSTLRARRASASDASDRVFASFAVGSTKSSRGSVQTTLASATKRSRSLPNCS